MVIKKLYHFLDPDFGYPFVEYFHRMKLYEEFEIILIFSSKKFLPVRRFWNPLRLLDIFFTGKIQSQIEKRYEKYGYKMIFSKSVNHDFFSDSISRDSRGICTGFNQIFKQNLIDKFTDFVNIHPSLLPFYRGPTPIEWCVHNNEEFTGWSLHKINNKIDDGEILFQNVLCINSKSVNEIKSEISDQARKTLYNYLKAETRFNKKRVQAENFYSNKINYISFFNEKIQK